MVLAGLASSCIKMPTYVHIKPRQRKPAVACSIPKQATYVADFADGLASMNRGSVHVPCRASWWLMPQTCPQLHSPPPLLLGPQWVPCHAPWPRACRNRTCPEPASHVQPAAAHTAPPANERVGKLALTTKLCQRHSTLVHHTTRL
jgi:hypothetical protein